MGGWGAEGAETEGVGEKAFILPCDAGVGAVGGGAGADGGYAELSCAVRGGLPCQKASG